MVIFVTDAGMYWNHETPILEKYADCVVVVSVYGKKVTDKYKCIVSPYKQVGMGCDNYSIQSLKYKTLESIKEELRNTHTYHDDILFLTDTAPESLYPYLILKDTDKSNSLHLWCMSPWKMEPIRRRKAHRELLHDISNLNSLLYIDNDMIWKSLDKKATIKDLNFYCQNLFAEMLPQVIYEIDTKINHSKKYYYDLKIGRYIEIDNSYESLIKAKPIKKEIAEAFIPETKRLTEGILSLNPPPDIADRRKEYTQKLSPRLDGKKVCEELKKMRKSLADANGIKYKIVDCPSKGPCAGTCRQCDKELRYLQEQMEKIPEEKRVYPQHKLDRESKSEALKVKRAYPRKPTCSVSWMRQVHRKQRKKKRKPFLLIWELCILQKKCKNVLKIYRI